MKTRSENQCSIGCNRDYNQLKKVQKRSKIMKNVGKWLYLLGLLVAAVVGLLGFSAVWLSLILALVGILAAILFVDSDDIVHIGIRYLVLGAVFSVLDGIPFVGPYLTGFFGGVFAFLGPVVLTTLVMWFVRKTFFSKE
jgi:hypothetical protein